MPPFRKNNNFIANQTQEILPSDPFRQIAILVFIFSIIVSLSVYGSLYYFQAKNKVLEDNVKSLESEISKMPLKDMVQMYNKITNINTILSTRNNVLLVLNLLADSVEDGVYFDKMDISTKEKYAEMSVFGVTNSYENIVKQIDSLKRESESYKSIIKKVSLKSVSSDKDNNIKFLLSVEVDMVNKNQFMIEAKKYDPTYQSPSNVEINFGGLNTSSVVSSSSIQNALPATNTSDTITPTSTTSTTISSSTKIETKPLPTVIQDTKAVPVEKIIKIKT
jgi:hypothetical protein